jgi:hypothetical protein
MPTRQDGVDILLTYLNSVSALTTFVSSRIYGPPGDIPDGITGPCRFICIAADGGPPHPDVPMAAETFPVMTYGETQGDAAAVFNTLFDACHRAGNQRVTVGGKICLIRRIDITRGPQHSPEPATGWPRVIGALRMVFCEWTFAT